LSISVLGTSDIMEHIKKKRLIIYPFSEDSISGCGLDLSLGKEIARLINSQEIFDTKKHNRLSTFYKKETGLEFVINPNERVLLCTLERVALPPNIMGFVGLRSSYSRLGLILTIGFVDPGFKGQLTLEVIGSSFPVKVYVGDRIFHLVLAKLKALEAYKGKYQNQKGVTFPIFS